MRLQVDLRGLSQEGSGFGHWRQLLMRASERSEDQLTRAFQAQGLAFDLSPYLTHARKSLEVAARELFALNKKLIDLKLKKRIPEKLVVAATPALRLFSITELGLLGSVDWFLATPSAEVNSLEIERLRDNYTTNGGWFPIEVSVESLLFVIDDDGSIFVSTENYPTEMLDKARTILHDLAGFLYS